MKQLVILTNVKNLPKPGDNLLQRQWEPERESQRAIESQRETGREPVRARGNQSELEKTRKSHESRVSQGELTSIDNERETGSKTPYLIFVTGATGGARVNFFGRCKILRI